MRDLPPYIKSIDSYCELLVHVVPGGSRDEILGNHDGRLKLKLSAVAEKGKANKALLLLLAQTLRCPASKILLVRGESSRQKTLRIQMPAHKVAAALEDARPHD